MTGDGSSGAIYRVGAEGLPPVGAGQSGLSVARRGLPNTQNKPESPSQCWKSMWESGKSYEPSPQKQANKKKQKEREEELLKLHSFTCNAKDTLKSNQQPPLGTAILELSVAKDTIWLIFQNFTLSQIDPYSQLTPVKTLPQVWPHLSWSVLWYDSSHHMLAYQCRVWKGSFSVLILVDWPGHISVAVVCGSHCVALLCKSEDCLRMPVLRALDAYRLKMTFLLMADEAPSVLGSGRSALILFPLPSD